MFGIVTAHLSKVSDAEKARYRELYCGLCRALKSRYGQVSRAVLTYDLTFYIMLANSLHEPREKKGAERCVAHPTHKMPYAQSAWTDYAADLAVALAYHKCLDDVNDGRSKKARAASALLARAYRQAQGNIPCQCHAIEQSMASISAIEAAIDASPDAAANEFGALLGELFAHQQGIWADTMREFGDQLGRFIYLMDAAVDYADDKKTGAYNPFVRLEMQPENMKTLLAILIGNAAATFEKLPLEQDLHLMQSVLYSGVWQKFNETYAKNGKDGSTVSAEDTASEEGESERQAR